MLTKHYSEKCRVRPNNKAHNNKQHEIKEAENGLRKNAMRDTLMYRRAEFVMSN